ncbi:MAG: hypothetical protein SPJ19_04695 [Candidatus Borkfalkiaceae bacterium]|nr:hypothetical protein [Christensenellaceae bacterium]
MKKPNTTTLVLGIIATALYLLGSLVNKTYGATIAELLRQVGAQAGAGSGDIEPIIKFFESIFNFMTISSIVFAVITLIFTIFSGSVNAFNVLLIVFGAFGIVLGSLVGGILSIVAGVKGNKASKEVPVQLNTEALNVAATADNQAATTDVTENNNDNTNA